jgi:hypothetical protein
MGEMLFGPPPTLIITVPAISALLIAGREVFHGFMIIIRAMIVIVKVVIVIIIPTHPWRKLLIVLLQLIRWFSY